MAKQSITAIRKAVVTLDLVHADTGNALTDQEKTELAYDTPILKLVPTVTHALDNKRERGRGMKP